MSRIEEALKRAQAPQHTTVETPVVSAWHFDRLPAEHDEPEAARPSEPDARSAAGMIAASEPHDEQGELRLSHWDRGFSRAVAEKLVVMKDTSPLVVEQFRKIAATLHQLQLERNVRVVMVASALQNEGKTLTATNLALTLSESYRRRVLLIDADLRRPQLHDIFQLPNGSGLNEGLKAAVEQRLSVTQISPRLAVLPAGRPDADPMRILTSERMRQVIAEAAAAFDWVILDAPPVVPVSDSHLLASMVDLAVLVIAAGRTPHKMITRALEIIGRERVAGVVLNGVEASVAAATAGGYGAYHHAPSDPAEK
jgi:protein-tyrosine kinase